MIKEADHGWLMGELAGKLGYFPASYVKGSLNAGAVITNSASDSMVPVPRSNSRGMLTLYLKDINTTLVVFVASVAPVPGAVMRELTAFMRGSAPFVAPFVCAKLQQECDGSALRRSDKASWLAHLRSW